ncbi:hypothetical protein CHUAL_004231 [Chamberlinius hualienensis]
MKTTVAIWFLMFGSAVVLLLLVYFPPNSIPVSVPSVFMDLNDSWIARLGNNLLGYALIIVPGFLIKKLVQKKNYLENSGGGCTPNVIKLCFYGDSSGGSSDQRETEMSEKKIVSSSRKAWLMIGCFVGLQCSYLVWGLLQERIMTVDYHSENSEKSERFRDSQFLVFVNRILAFLLSGMYVFMTRQPRHKAPAYRYSYCSFSNIMSSWCQYEALKYVNFPIQVLAKASKIIPVMLMGKLISKKTYDYYEYVSAVIISTGMTMFLMGNDDVDGHGSSYTNTTFSGIVILAGYMIFDSFTANWQSELFKQHSMTHMQMMCGVNMFSVLFTSVSLLQQGGFVQSWNFMWNHPAFNFDIFILSLTSATGQLFIFYTISQFGAVIFTIMMTIRQLLAIILSCVIYHHSITSPGIFGIVLVFSAIFLRIYCAHRKKQLTARTHGSSNLLKV